MLLKSNAELRTYAKLTLLFDDDTIKEQIICTGTKLKITYRHDDSKVEKTGIVKSIARFISKDIDSKDYKSCVNHHTRPLRPEEQPSIPRAFDRTCCSNEHTEDCAEYWFKPAKPNFAITLDCSMDYNSDMIRVFDTDIIDIELLVSDDRIKLLNEYKTAKAIDNITSSYTSDSFEYLTNVLKITKVILDDPTADISVCETTYQILHNAVISLAPNVVPEPVEPDTDPSDLNNNNENEEESIPSETEETPNDSELPKEDDSDSSSTNESPIEETSNEIDDSETPQEEVNTDGNDNDEEAAGGSGESGI